MQFRKFGGTRALLLAGAGSTALVICAPQAAHAQSAAAADATAPVSGAAVAAKDAGPAGETPAAQTLADVGDIVVTAQRREQRALKTPLSLTALDGALIQNKQVVALADLQFAVPGIRSGQQQGVNRLFIRGIGLSSFASGADSSVAFYVDGVYIGRPSQQLSSFYDITRIEVLRGPQGALYGRNATGGAVNLITSSPDRELGGYINVSLGNYAQHEAEGAVSAPLTPNGDLRARVAFKLVDRGGYGYDRAANHPVNDAHNQSGRVTLQYNPNNDIDISLIGEYTHEKDNNNYAANFGAFQFANLGLCPFTDGSACILAGVADGGFEVKNSQDAATALEGYTNIREGYAVTLNAKFSLTDTLSLSSITGWRQFSRYNASNSDGASTGLGNTFYNEKNHQTSQELILNYDGGPLQLTAGASYYNEHLRNFAFVPFVQFGDVLYIQDGTLDIDAFAGYAQGTYSITPALRLTAAGRYSTEKRATDGVFTFLTVTPIDDQRRWSAFTPKAGIEYDVVPGTLAYASFTKGFKSGTFNVGQVNPAINPEKITAYEVGIKSRFLDNMIDVTGAFFHYKYTDLQVNKIVGIATLTTNAAAATTNGFETAINIRPVRGLTLDANFTYLDSKFTDFLSINPIAQTSPAEDLNGKLLPGSPKYALAGGAQYVIDTGGDAELTLRVDAAYQSRVYFSEFNENQLSQKPVTKVNTSVRFDTGRNWSVTVWGKNVFNTLVANNKILGIALWGYPIYGAYDPPATVGGTLALKF